ncbi:YciI family protein [Streptoalloteichus hindustanus]|uniref:Uncharacterized conserved protein YciI, contains a putative active-site phosphohistidine n=1 Tax=Streptoalloteichus hindustanus TaxID=2017 RepID=A0A1M5PIL2_STRHI|nr:YciI family protein [Streptoalloteichus hindustanus]SHH01592.1 Uncharacterized conserved protein YciI, contains a putative active-site phosphohistidine [Streptoalloteichus hindustanus]
MRDAVVYWVPKAPHRRRRGRTDTVFLILLDYVAPLAEIDRLLPEHRAYLERNYDAGRFLMSGPREPRTGGVILATANDRAELVAVVETDPFVTSQAATYEIVEFTPTRSEVSRV